MADDKTKTRDDTQSEDEDVVAHNFVIEEAGDDDTGKTKTKAKYAARANEAAAARANAAAAARDEAAKY